MKEVAMGLGIILIFAGVLVLPISLQSSINTEDRLVANREFVVFPDWTISAQMNESEELAVYFSRPNTEGVPDGDVVLAEMYVDITDPNGGNTTLNVAFKETNYEIRVDRNDGGLLVKTPTFNVGGKTQYNGNYTASVHTYALADVGFYYPNSSTMRRLELHKIIERIDYPNLAALPVAASLAAIGLVLVLWGARSQKRRARPRKPGRE